MKNAYLDRYHGDASDPIKKKMPDPIELGDVILRKDLVLPKKPGDPPKRDQYLQQEEFDAEKTKYDAKVAKYKRILQNREWFKWYWTCLLPKVCGNKRWGIPIRNYGLILTHAPVNSKKKYVTSSDEALVLLLYENCGQRFPYVAKLGKRGKGQKLTPVEKKHPEYQSAYSNAQSGQQKWGGWDLESRQRFKEILDHISIARRKPETEALETGILKEIRVEAGLESGDNKKQKSDGLSSYDIDHTKIAKVCVESDEYDTDQEEKKKEFTPFAGKYRGTGPKKSTNTKAQKYKKDDDSEEEEDDEEVEDDEVDDEAEGDDDDDDDEGDDDDGSG